MRDLRFLLYFADTGTHAPEGPGWYLLASRKIGNENETQEIIPHVRLTAEEVTRLGLIFDNIITDKPLNWTEGDGYHKYEGTVSEAVDAANKDAAAHVKQRLQDAENQILALEQLRERMKEFN
jgi:hypothetical protein